MFFNRREGKSRLSFRKQVDCLQHFKRLCVHRHPLLREFFRFSVVGFTGLLVDTAVLVSLVELANLDPRFAVLFAFGVGVSWTYVFNRSWSFPLGRASPIYRTFPYFFSVCLAGLGVRIGVMHLLIKYAGMGVKPWYILASFIGIAVATFFNFFGSRHVVFATRK